ncbi:MAG: hypothetical protein Tsb0010_12150 [Parvularculaceae bacterium]
MLKKLFVLGLSVGGLALTGACATTAHGDGARPGSASESASAAQIRAYASGNGEAAKDKFERDRAAILAMTGDFDVTFDFTETVSFADGYEIKPPYVTGGDEIVRVIEDRGDFISLQHILVVGGEEKFPVKHWRQDWIYEPAEVLVFVGGNAWEKRPVSPEEARGKWAQIVYQVDDAPRYGALAAWTHDAGVSQWEPPRELRPLPRRDATKRDDYHAIAAVNRHAITPDGWVHEQDNTKLIQIGGARALAREIGINTYSRSDDFDVSVAEDYWAATSEFWAGVRAEWRRYIEENESFGLTVQGEPEEVYSKILEIAERVDDGETPVSEGVREARRVIAEYVRLDIGELEDRLGGEATGSAY